MPWTNKYLSGFQYEPHIHYSREKVVDLGPRLPRAWCHALKWQDESPGMCNGTRLQGKALYKHVIEATIFTGVNQGETVFIPRIPLTPSDYHFEFKRLQFPVKFCCAITINKAQGQTLKVAEVHLTSDCFSQGQFYVACSRVSSPDSLVILQPESKTKDVVYKEVLSNSSKRRIESLCYANYYLGYIDKTATVAPWN